MACLFKIVKASDDGEQKGFDIWVYDEAEKKWEWSDRFELKRWAIESAVERGLVQATKAQIEELAG